MSHTFTRPGSAVRVHVNSDWSGDVVITDERCPALKVEVPAVELLAGDFIAFAPRISGSNFPLGSIVQAVSIAAEWFTRRSIQEAVDSALTIDELATDRARRKT